MGAVLLSQDARGVATVTLNRPERRNAFDDALIRELDRCFAELARDSSVRFVVLTGAGSAFSAGAEARASREGREGLAAFLEKRKPDFRT
ncbi:MAG: enoyl-CoA hydratase/isomerase family protein [Stellaceae bacterium]